MTSIEPYAVPGLTVVDQEGRGPARALRRTVGVLLLVAMLAAVAFWALPARTAAGPLPGLPPHVGTSTVKPAAFLGPGDCFLDLLDHVAVELVDCDDPRAYEVYASRSPARWSQMWPGDDSVGTTRGWQFCDEALPLRHLLREQMYWYSNEEEWDSGFGYQACVLTPAADPVDDEDPDGFREVPTGDTGHPWVMDLTNGTCFQVTDAVVPHHAYWEYSTSYPATAPAVSCLRPHTAEVFAVHLLDDELDEHNHERWDAALDHCVRAFVATTAESYDGPSAEIHPVVHDTRGPARSMCLLITHEPVEGYHVRSPG